MNDLKPLFEQMAEKAGFQPKLDYGTYELFSEDCLVARIDKQTVEAIPEDALTIWISRLPHKRRDCI